MKQLEVSLDTMDMGLRQTHEEVSRAKSTTTRDTVQALDQGMKEELLHMEIANVNKKINSVLEIISKRPHVGLLVKFPPKSIAGAGICRMLLIY